VYPQLTGLVMDKAYRRHAATAKQLEGGSERITASARRDARSTCMT
jgi:hypothetical protein